MYLFHGTNNFSAQRILIEGINLWVGKKRVDFGRGFYTTPDQRFAERCALWKTSDDDTPAVIRLDVSDELLSQLPGIRQFEYADAEWAQFIVNNRAGQEYMRAIGSTDHNLGRRPRFDVVRGRVADGKIRELVRELMELRQPVTEEMARSLINDSFTEQVTFHTELALRCIKNIEQIQ